MSSSKRVTIKLESKDRRQMRVNNCINSSKLTTIYTNISLVFTKSVDYHVVDASYTFHIVSETVLRKIVVQIGHELDVL